MEIRQNLVFDVSAKYRRRIKKNKQKNFFDEIT